VRFLYFGSIVGKRFGLKCTRITDLFHYFIARDFSF